MNEKKRLSEMNEDDLIDYFRLAIHDQETMARFCAYVLQKLDTTMLVVSDILDDVAQSELEDEKPQITMRPEFKSYLKMEPGFKPNR